MSIDQILELCIVLFLIVIVVDVIRSQRVRRFLIELFVFGLIVGFTALFTNATAGHVAFGAGTAPLVVLLVIFGAIVLGISARYFFYLKGEFSWLDFAKPMCISPVLVLSLAGSVQAVRELNTMQVVVFALLGYQNGFFGQTVLHQVKPVRRSRRALQQG